jgi:hypothetical protein
MKRLRFSVRPLRTPALLRAIAAALAMLGTAVAAHPPVHTLQGTVATAGSPSIVLLLKLV